MPKASAHLTVIVKRGRRRPRRAPTAPDGDPRRSGDIGPAQVNDNRAKSAYYRGDLACHGLAVLSPHEADERNATGLRGDALGRTGAGISARTSAGGAARSAAARPGKVSDSGVEAPAGADSRPPGTRLGLSRGRALVQLELSDDDPGGTPVIALVPPLGFPDPPAVLSVIVEQRPAAGADVVFKFRHCKAPQSRQPGRGCQRYDAEPCRSVSVASLTSLQG